MQPAVVRSEPRVVQVGAVVAQPELVTHVQQRDAAAGQRHAIQQQDARHRMRVALDRDEVLDVIEMPLSEAITKIEDGTIRDGKTIVGLQAVYIKVHR